MQNFNLLNLIFHHFLNANLHCLLVYHCWDKPRAANKIRWHYFVFFLALNHFAMLAADFSIYSQLANLNDSAALINFGLRYMRHDRPKIGVFMDFNCNHTNLLIKESSHQKLFNYHYNWLIYDELANFSGFNEVFQNVNLSVDTQLTYVVAQHRSSNKSSQSVQNHNTVFITSDVYNNGRILGGALNVTKNYKIKCLRTACQRMEYLTNLYQRTLYGNRESLTDVTMRVAAVVQGYDIQSDEQDIINYLLQDKEFHLEPFSKFGMRIFMVLKEFLYTKVAFTFYDRWSDGETKGGPIGGLVDETADIATAPFFHTAIRFRYLTPIAQTGASRTICMFRTPSNSGIKGRVFLDPFSTKVWILFAIILLLSAVFLWIIFRVEFHQNHYILEFVPSLLTTCLISFGSACVQGSALVPGSLPGRLTFISVTLISFIMYNYYTSVVVSSLLGSPVKSQIKTLAGLADSDLDVGLQSLPYTRTYLNFSTLAVVRHFVQRKIATEKSAWYSLQEGINKMRSKTGFVFIFEAQSGYFIIENQYEDHEMCDLNEIPFRSDTLLSMHLHKNSSYKEIIRLKLMRMFESGVYSKHSILVGRTRLNCLSNNFVLSVGMEYAAPLFLLLLCSYLFVLIILAIEIICFRYASIRPKGKGAVSKQQAFEG